MQVKPTSKVVQISVNPNSDHWDYLALCEDGSIWGFVRTEWTCLLEAPIQPKNDLPAVGNIQKIATFNSIEDFESFLADPKNQIIKFDVKAMERSYCHQQGFFGLVFYSEN